MISQWNTDNDVIWKHFFKKELFVAQCIYCRRLIKSAYKKHNLHLHIRFQHTAKIIEIEKGN